MKLTRREQRAIELSRELTEKMRDCSLSGVDPYLHPEVRVILKQLSDDMPEAARRLQDRQEAIELELAELVKRWHSSVSGATVGDVLEQVFAMIEKVDDEGSESVSRITQNVEAQKLLTEYARIDKQIIEMLSDEE
jgi:hypothetical protein